MRSKIILYLIALRLIPLKDTYKVQYINYVQVILNNQASDIFKDIFSSDNRPI